MDLECVHVVSGKDVQPTDSKTLRDRAVASQRVVFDLGAGDGRWIYRLARTHPTWLCVALDANATGLGETSHRARRKAARGGAPNAWFLRAALEALPQGLEGLADELHVHLPWGSLLRAVLAAEPAALRRMVFLCRPGAILCVRINVTILKDPELRRRLGLPAAGNQTLEMRLRAGYEAAGIRLTVGDSELDEHTSWARRLGGGRSMPMLALDGVVDGGTRTAQPAGTLSRWIDPLEVNDET